ncbi:hypothetical protein DMC30DRAFT_416832 [Rhodotorula diobovata]|uniref:Uncharacterized protein n=1 Tax=Rhodotorula diobovata TaxID=5288 RepID=A0A5C5FUS1_9BASI|nr:hypothetical protein DMC30DRAFT_416832 [Rhodotorula diobovata]
MVSLTSKLAAAGGLVFLALSLVATANADAHAPFALTRSTVGHGEVPHLVARQRFRGGGRGNPFRNAIGAAPKLTDGQLNPGNTNGQGQGTNDAQGTGQDNVNATSGLPADIVDTGDPQKNLFLDPSQIAKGLSNDGQAVPAAGQVASATSVNNFINNCLLRTDLPLTNGQQVTGGSCNAVPMGVIAAQNKAPSCKFTNPKNLDVIPPNQDFTITMAIKNLQTGNFVNAQQNYFSAPQATNDQGIIIGHSHVVVEQIDSLTSTTVTDPTKFAFFKGLNEPANNGVLSATVAGGLPEGVYKHGSLDDAVYFIASNDPNAIAIALGLNAANNAAAAGNNAANDGGDGAVQQQQQQDGNAGGVQQGGDAASGATGDASATAAAGDGAAAESSAAPSASASAATGGQQQQGGGRGNRSGNKRRDVPHGLEHRSASSLLERRLAALLERDEDTA